MSETSVDPSKIPTVPGIYISKGEGWLREAWTSVPNKLIRNPKIEWDAKGAFAWLASHQEMQFRVTAQMIAEAGPRGRNHAYDMIRELEKWGWVTRNRLRNPETGRTDIQVYKLHPNPVPDAERTFKPSKAKVAALAGFIPERVGMNPGNSNGGQDRPAESVPDRPGTDHSIPGRGKTDRPGALTRAHCPDPLEDHLLTEEEEHTPRERDVAAASPPCVTLPVKVEFFGKPPGPLKEDVTADAVQVKFYAQDADPFAGQDGHPDQAGIDWSNRPRSSAKVASRWLKTKHAPAAERLVDAYCKTVTMPRESRNDLLPFVDKMLQQGIADEVLLRAIPACFKAKCGPTLLHRFVTQILHQDAIVAGREATSTRNMNEQRENHNRWFRPDGSMRSPEEIAAMDRGGQGPLVVTGEVVRELPTG